MLLNDKVTIISGIGPGLGQQLSTLAAKEGAKVVLAARTPSKLDTAAQEINDLNLGTEVLKVPTDISDEAQCQRLIEQTMDKFGRVDVLFNSAYHPGGMDFMDKLDLKAWREAIDVNLFGTMMLTDAAAQVMKKQGGGAIVMINTMAARKLMPSQGGYATSKAALSSATRYFANELGKYKIRVNSAVMGWMWGPTVEGYFTMMQQQTGRSLDELKADITQFIPLGEIPTDADCAKAALFLASDYAKVVTGATLDINGGEFMPL